MTRLQPPQGNAENILYASWLKAAEEARPDIERQLFRRMVEHATRVIWTILRSLQEDLAEEIAQDALLDLKDFKGDSSFSTWFHARIKHTCYNRRRALRSKLEQSIKEYMPAMKGSTDALDQVEVKIMLEQLTKDFTEFENKVLYMVLEGWTTREVAKILKTSASNVIRTWQRILERVR